LELGRRRPTGRGAGNGSGRERIGRRAEPGDDLQLQDEAGRAGRGGGTEIGGELGKKIGRERNGKKKHELRRAGTLTWALIPCHEYATYIIRGPKATYIVHVQGTNMQETP
jgi:hypothetical protein